jgi:hypothetical protein
MSDFQYAEYLNFQMEIQMGKRGVKQRATPYKEPDIEKFKKIIERSISENENINDWHYKDLMNVYKMFVYNFSYPKWEDFSKYSEKYLAWSLSVESTIVEFANTKQDPYVNNSAEKRARELFRKYFPDLFEEDKDDYYKKAIYSILTASLTGKTESTNDRDIIKSINLLGKLNFLSQKPDKFVKRGCGSWQEEEAQRILEEAEKKRLTEEKERQKQERLAAAEAEKKRLAEEKERLEQERLAAKEAAEQRKKDRLLHADDDL